MNREPYIDIKLTVLDSLGKQDIGFIQALKWALGVENSEVVKEHYKNAKEFLDAGKQPAIPVLNEDMMSVFDELGVKPILRVHIDGSYKLLVEKDGQKLDMNGFLMGALKDRPDLEEKLNQPMSQVDEVISEVALKEPKQGVIR